MFYGGSLWIQTKPQYLSMGHFLLKELFPFSDQSNRINWLINFGHILCGTFIHSMIKNGKTYLKKEKDLRETSDFHYALNHLYRIFFYDCPPLQKKMHHPLTNQCIDFAKSDRAKWRLSFHEALRKKRKVALRLGVMDEANCSWTIIPSKIKLLYQHKITIDDLTENDYVLTTHQKGVDMRIGIDIASVAYKKQASKMVLISGDSDFVPAAKLARREGVDFILDPMHASIKSDLHEHIDGKHTVFPKPAPKNKNKSDKTTTPSASQ